MPPLYFEALPPNRKLLRPRRPQAQTKRQIRMKRFVSIIDTLNLKIGRAMGWLMVALVLLVTVDVIGRYVFNTGAVIIQELEWWFFAIIFLLCAGYTALYEEHVRVDIIYSRLSRRWQNIVDMICSVIFLLPMCLLIIGTSRWFIWESWKVGEFSPDPGGLPAYYLLKAMIPLGFILLLLQGISNFYKSYSEFKGLGTYGPLQDSMSVRVAQQTSKTD